MTYDEMQKRVHELDNKTELTEEECKEFILLENTLDDIHDNDMENRI